jgi:Uma2 family endonuclease
MRQRHRWTEAEFLAFEQDSPSKHEFLDGEIYDMAGASPQHISLNTNIVASLGTQLRQRPCYVMANDMRLKVPRITLYTYPDVMVVCGQRLYDAQDKNALINPTLIIEVLSKSTEQYDKGLKFEHYKMIESLQAYLLVSQYKLSVEYHTRQNDNTWAMTKFTALSDTLMLTVIGCQLSLEDVYDKVEFEGE